MNAMEVGQALVTLSNDGKEEAVLEQYYAPGIVSIEGEGSDEMPARMEGIEAVKQKWAWWYENNDVHGTTAHGPYLGHRADQFLVRFTMDLTPKGGERQQMDEVGIYTVADGKIVEEAFFYNVGG